LAYFSIFEKKIQKIAKFAKFRMSLKHPIFTIFGHLKRRWESKRPYFVNSEKKVFFKRLQKIFLKKKIQSFCCNQKSDFFEKSIFAKKTNYKLIFQLLMPKNEFFE
jgi:hypothetical protein